MFNNREIEISKDFFKLKNDLMKLLVNPKGIHGINHIKRVYILVNLIADMENINERDRKILSYCALYHDIGRVNDWYDINHGVNSFLKIEKENLIDNKYKEIVRFIIENHCNNDKDSIMKINNYKINDKERAMYLYKVFKDSDGLDRVRIMDFNKKYLRLKISNKLIPIAQKLYYKDTEINKEHYILRFIL